MKSKTIISWTGAIILCLLYAWAAAKEIDATQKMLTNVVIDQAAE